MLVEADFLKQMQTVIPVKCKILSGLVYRGSQQVKSMEKDEKIPIRIFL